MSTKADKIASAQERDNRKDCTLHGGWVGYVKTIQHLCAFSAPMLAVLIERRDLRLNNEHLIKYLNDQFISLLIVHSTPTMNIAAYQAKRQRLAALELRAAHYGIDAPAEVVNEIAELRRELRCPLIVNVRERHFNTLPLCVILAVLALILAVLLLVIVILG